MALAVWWIWGSLLAVPVTHAPERAPYLYDESQHRLTPLGRTGA